MKHQITFLFVSTIFMISFFDAGRSFTPNTSYFLNCGGPTIVTNDNPPRKFIENSGYFLDTSSHTVASNTSDSYSNLLYASARIFTDDATYQFPLNSIGNHVLRLHFFSIPSNDYDFSLARFNVSVLRRFLLITNFTVKVSASPVIKEYFLWVDSGQDLEVAFIPGSKSSFAFVNAIEVFTAPIGLIKYAQASQHPFETVYRLNVGGALVTPENDTLWRTWSPDEKYLFSGSSLTVMTASIDRIYGGVTKEIASSSVYSTARIMNITDYERSTGVFFNVSWSFLVSQNYKYLVRLHFCDFLSLAFENTIIFNVYVADGATEDLRSRHFTDGLSEAFFLDFGVSPVNSYINVSISPLNHYSVQAANAYLNGLEMFKVNNSNGIPDGNLFDYFKDSQKSVKRNSTKVIVIVVVPGILILTVLLVFSIIGKKKWCSKAKNVNSVSIFGSLEGSAPSKIPWLIIKAATRDFDEKLVLGRGGFGKVYKGVLTDGTIVAVKRGLAGSRQGFPEFNAEIDILTKIRHQNLVSLIGYCDEKGERILIYEYMANGTLRDCLYSSPDKPCLSWKQRLEICIGAARGLHYLHTGFSHAIIHRDIKSSNILLGENYLAKVSDFGLSKLGPCYGETHITTNIKGTFGYIDPRYFRTLKLTDKSDVYSFGVLLFEVLCARPVIQHGVTEEQLNLVEWALHWKRLGQLENIVDARIAGTIEENSLREFADIAEKCLSELVEVRPRFGDVLWNLEHALQLQLRMDENEFPTILANLTVDQNVGIVIGHSITTMSSIFSELRNEGR